MIKNYLIEVTFDDPYPRKTQYRSAASNLSAAISRGVKSWRKENKGRKVKQIIVKAIQL